MLITKPNFVFFYSISIQATLFSIKYSNILPLSKVKQQFKNMHFCLA